MEKNAVFSVKDVSGYYGETQALKGINMEILREVGDGYNRAVRVRQIDLYKVS